MSTPNKALTFAALVRLRTQNFKKPDGAVMLTASEAAYIAQGIEAIQLELNNLKPRKPQPDTRPGAEMVTKGKQGRD